MEFDPKAARLEREVLTRVWCVYRGSDSDAKLHAVFLDESSASAYCEAAGTDGAPLVHQGCYMEGVFQPPALLVVPNDFTVRNHADLEEAVRAQGIGEGS